VKISIITACFNTRQYLDKYFDSILLQDYKDIEVIFVDDCSTDGSLEYALSVKDLRVKVIHNKERQFCSGAYNTALGQVTGQICGVVDSDDALMFGAFDIINSLYKKYPDIDFIYSQHQWCDETMTKQRKGLSSPPLPGKSLAEMAKLGKHCYSHWRTFRTALKNKTTLFPLGLKYSVDKNLGFSLEEVGQGAFYSKSLYLYRYHKQNMSLTAAGDQKRQTMQLADQHLQGRKKENIKPKMIRTIF